MDSDVASPLPVPKILAEVRISVEVRIEEFLQREIVRWRKIDSDLEIPLTALRDFVASGGKRLRPAFCYWSFVGAGGDPDDLAVIDVGASLEMLHTFALIHDDVMDGSDRRRSQPSIHARFIQSHADNDWKSEGRRFGEGAAILIGDLALIYADMLFDERDKITRSIYDELRIELCVGQYLDLTGAVESSVDPIKAARIEEYKSGKYTVERPLHLGAALANRFDDLNEPLSAVGLPLGAAFQLRDDLLGVFGSAATTGKPVGDDLREGKLTPLVAMAAARADAGGLKILNRIGQRNLEAEEILLIQDILVSTGATVAVETEIKRLAKQAMTALAEAPILASAREALRELGNYVAWRDH